MNNIVSVKNLSKSFKNNGSTFKAVDNISFDISTGSIAAIIGPNGAGKTTTIKIIGGYLLPTSGEVFIAGDKKSYSSNRQNINVGISLGGENGFYDRSTAYQNLKFFAALKKIPRKDQTAEIDRVLELVNLTNVKNENVYQYSKGMKQRLQIARALLGSPKLLMLDEPTSGLDVESARDLQNNIQKSLSKDRAIILTSHTMSEVERLADQLIVIGSGEVYYNGPTSEFKKFVGVDENLSLEETYLQISDELKRV
ncbi:ABC transporter ATP-binding protein [Companilactobacillus metriopterae]|uniref:ABC transporter ATP-binding protein n=1 Tax=Companilactobacillus metriopterae TaxID=1909267 RepID=UPI00100BF33D|nr:ABC transporter ATP-binding protein [Companilactobacillus metriopterae]